MAQTYCKPCLCAKHKELRDRKRIRCIQAHLGATGQLHLDPAHAQIADANADPYAGEHLSLTCLPLHGHSVTASMPHKGNACHKCNAPRLCQIARIAL